ALKELNCCNNQLTDLDVPASNVLSHLDCHINQLTTLDVSTNTALRQLDCSNNQLTTLDLKNLTGLFKWWARISPQRSEVVIPVIKRDAYEVDAAAFLGRLNAAVDGQPLDADGKVRLSEFPKLATYTFEAVFSDGPKTVTVEAANFQMHQVITAKTEGNGSISWEGKPAVNEEFLVPENSTPTFTVTPASGYQVATLTVNGN
ncbi:MAG: leucine-rich repeat domain-containing protein, partial [Raoultibacter sp.]